MNRYCFLALLILLFSGSVQSANRPNSALCAVTIFQKDSSTKTDIPLYHDTTIFVKGVRTSAFLSVFSVEVELTDFDSLAASFSTTITTLSPLNSTRSRQFRVEYGLPARISDIEVKPGAFYRIDIVPLAVEVTDTADCPYTETTMQITPSANLDLYYFTGTMGDYFLPSVKGIIEAIYERAKTVFGLTLPGKYNLFLCPCPLQSTIWDKRFGLSTNPLRSNAYVIFTKEFNAADPFPIVHTALLRSWGYAPAPLVDGLASFYTLSLYDMKELVASKTYLSLDTLLNTASYRRADPYLADRCAASFCDFLSRTYGLGKIEVLYQKADDIHLRAQTEQVFGKSLATLEQEWVHWVDTTQLTKPEVAAAVDMAAAMYDYPRMQKLAEVAVKISENRADSIKSVNLLEQAYFSNGDYTHAAQMQKVLTNIQASVTSHWIGLGSYLLMANGDTSAIESAFRTAKQLDTVSAVPAFNTALMAFYQGNQRAAIDILLQIESNQNMSFAEAKILLAELLQATGRKDKDPIALYKQAIAQLEQVLETKKSPYLMAWIGHAYMGMGDTENAISYLQTALLLETRPFYEGLICLWLGNAFDQLGERDAAKIEYQNVLNLASASYTKQQAQQYLTSPYVLKP